MIAETLTRKIKMNEEESPFAVYDDGEGIVLEMFFVPGVSMNIYLDDEAAQQMIDIIQNKLNARL